MRSKSPSELSADRDFVCAFSTLIDRSGGDASCHLWKGRVHNGFPVHTLPPAYRPTATYREMSAVRIAWLLDGRPLPTGTMLRRHCLGGPSCVRADHYHAIKVRTRRKGKRLSREDVLRIRALLAGSGARQCEIVREYGVSKATVSRYARGLRWKVAA